MAQVLPTTGCVQHDILNAINTLVTSMTFAGGSTSISSVSGVLPVSVSSVSGVLPVSSSANTPVIAYGSLRTSVATFARPADTLGLSAKDGIAQSTNAASCTILSFPNAIRDPSASAYITRARLITDVGSVTATFRLHLFTSTVTPIADNAQLTALWANRAVMAGYIDFDAMTTEGTGSDASRSLMMSLRIPFSSVNTTTIFGLLQTTAAFTPTSAQNFFIELTTDVN